MDAIKKQGGEMLRKALLGTYLKAFLIGIGIGVICHFIPNLILQGGLTLIAAYTFVKWNMAKPSLMESSSEGAKLDLMFCVIGEGVALLLLEKLA